MNRGSLSDPECDSTVRVGNQMYLIPHDKEHTTTILGGNAIKQEVDDTLSEGDETMSVYAAMENPATYPSYSDVSLNGTSVSPGGRRKGEIGRNSSSETFEDEDDYPDVALAEDPAEAFLANMALEQIMSNAEDLASSGKRPPERTRKSNFCSLESMLLLEQIRLGKNVVMSKGADTLSVKRKRQVWQSIADAVNMQFGRGRKIDEFRKRFMDLRRVVTYEQDNYKKTGTWPRGAPSLYTKLILEIMAAASPVTPGMCAKLSNNVLPNQSTENGEGPDDLHSVGSSTSSDDASTPHSDLKDTSSTQCSGGEEQRTSSATATVPSSCPMESDLLSRHPTLSSSLSSQPQPSPLNTSLPLTSPPPPPPPIQKLQQQSSSLQSPSKPQPQGIVSSPPSRKHHSSHHHQSQNTPSSTSKPTTTANVSRISSQLLRKHILRSSSKPLPHSQRAALWQQQQELAMNGNPYSDAVRLGIGLSTRLGLAAATAGGRRGGTLLKRKSGDDSLYDEWLRSEIAKNQSEVAKNQSEVAKNQSLERYHDAKIAYLHFQMGQRQPQSCTDSDSRKS